MATVNIKDLIKGGAKIVDVRTVEEFEDGAYPGAVNIPLNVLSAKLDQIGPKTGPVVLYCASGARSAQAARILAQAGFTNVVNVGGLDDMPQP